MAGTCGGASEMAVVRSPCTTATDGYSAAARRERERERVNQTGLVSSISK